MTIFTPYMNADQTRYTPDWQRIERYEYCSHIRPEKGEGFMKKFADLFKKDDARKAA